MSVFVSRDITVPKLAKKLSDFAHGEIVYLNENGVPVEFYVAKHDYESGLNGAGKTLLARKIVHSQMAYDTDGEIRYQYSDVDTWLNGTYKGTLDSAVQSLIGQTAFYYTPTWGSSASVTTLRRSVFIPSIAEFGFSSLTTDANVEGSALPTARLLQSTGKYTGSSVYQWTRSLYLTGNYVNGAIDNNGNGNGPGYTKPTTTFYWVRPMFTLPSDTKFDPDTFEIKGAK